MVKCKADVQMFEHEKCREMLWNVKDASGGRPKEHKLRTER